MQATLDADLETPIGPKYGITGSYMGSYGPCLSAALPAVLASDWTPHQGQGLYINLHNSKQLGTTVSMGPILLVPPPKESALCSIGKNSLVIPGLKSIQLSLTKARTFPALCQMRYSPCRIWCNSASLPNRDVLPGLWLRTVTIPRWAAFPTPPRSPLLPPPTVIRHK